MFGNNPQRPPDHGDGLTLEVQEVFYTLQGEGPLSGMPAIFIRLAGCNLACTWCDTDFESSYLTGNRLTIDQVCTKVGQLGPMIPKRPVVVITGGEPLRQQISPLVHSLLTVGYQVQIETAGICALPSELWGDVQAGRLVIVCSPKTPRLHETIRRFCTHWKYVVGANDVHPFDGLPYRSTQKPGAHDLVNGNLLDHPAIWRGFSHNSTVWVSPRDDRNPGLNAANVAAAVSSCLEHGHRLSLQTHKMVGLP